MMEIGSYFEKIYNNDNNHNSTLNWLPKNQSDYSFTFSGRSAIALAIVNILDTNDIKRVYMPSYCCNSMLSSFIKHNIEIVFYDVRITTEGLICDINYNEEIDLFFAMSYFGVEHGQDKIISLMKEKGVIVIEDITHRLLCEKKNSINADYLVASLRKWFPIPSGGLLMKKNDSIQVKPTKSSNHLVVDQIEAMELKARYLLKDDYVKKKDFFAKFNTLNNEIPNIDYSYRIDDYSLDILYGLRVDDIINKRTKNMELLYKSLTTFKNIKPLIQIVDSTKMTPLFVPILLKNSDSRDKLLQKLINNKIYCPVHWPISDIIKTNNQNIEMYNKEISLICDQRYGEIEMQKIIDTLGEFEQDYV